MDVLHQPRRDKKLIYIRLGPNYAAKECQAMLESMQESLPIDVLVVSVRSSSMDCAAFSLKMACRTLQGKKNVEVRPAHTNKGEIVQRLLYQYADTEFCMCAGDDKTDEDMFHSMARIFSTATPGLGGCAGSRPTIAPPESLKLFPSLSSGAGLPDGDHAGPVESKLDPSAMYMIAIEAREVSPSFRSNNITRIRVRR
jgi:trehalose 6-phosphate synthase/phosphatase